jgi:triphosphatase
VGPAGEVAAAPPFLAWAPIRSAVRLLGGAFTFSDPAILGEVPISLEVELKLTVDPADLPKLREALGVLAPGSATTARTLVSTYFETPDRKLRRAGSILRVREQDGHFIQTLKTEDPEGANLLARGEWEDPVADNWPDPQAAQSGPHLPDGAADGLRALFVTEVDRLTVDVEPLPGTLIEAAIDRGQVRAVDNGRNWTLSELELELKEGDPAALYDVALALLETVPLRVDLRSKSERGYRLADGDDAEPAAVSAGPVALGPDMTVEEALQRVGRACLGHLLRNEPAALAGGVEGVHQMRVAMRRLGSMLSAVKKLLPEAERRWVADEIRVLTEALGPARNLDVFATELLPPARSEAPDQPGWDELAAAAARARDAAHRRVADEIRSPRHAATILRLLRWFEGRGWQGRAGDAEGALGVAIGAVAPGVLDRHRRSMRKRSRHFRRLPARGRHRARIAVKKLRYAIELLDSLYDKRDARPFVNRLKRVQDELGRANDVRVAYGLVIELGRSETRAEPFADAAAQLLGRHERALAKSEKKLRRQLRELNRARPFWHG